MALIKIKTSPFYYTRFSIKGTKVFESTKTLKKGEAREYEEKRRADLRKELFLGYKPKKTWNEAVKRWLQEKQHKRSLKDDKLHINWLSYYLDEVPLDLIKTDLIEDIISKKKNVSNATINRILAVLKSILNKAYRDWEWIDQLPRIRMRVEDNKRIRWLSQEEAQRLLSNLPIYLQAPAQFALLTGLRASNLAQLQWNEIDENMKFLTISHTKMKNNKNFCIPLNDPARVILKQLKGDKRDFVFTLGNKPFKQFSSKAFRKALQLSGIKDFRWHDLRHTWASWHIQNGTSLQELFELGGWSSFNMVLRYAHLSKDHLTKASNNITIGCEKTVKPKMRELAEAL